MMSDFDPPRAVVRRLVADALAEDLGILGDITSLACVDEGQRAEAVFVARDEGVLAGTALAAETFRQLDEGIEVDWSARDGDAISPGSHLGRVTGPLRTILTGERTALNFMCHCSGIATTTRRYVIAAHGKARVLDTRKTLPGLRAVQRAAVRAGGGFNHRDSLSDAVLIKDNHVAATGIAKSIERARSSWPGRMIEVECDDLDQVVEARDAAADRVLLDNMTPEQVRRAVALLEGVAQVEVSGGVTLETIGAYAESGADFVSVGALTHSVPVFDIGLDILWM
jgi:nicotinate-nucleotide pyrophosphorylase (carboxylating)